MWSHLLRSRPVTRSILGILLLLLLLVILLPDLDYEREEFWNPDMDTHDLDAYEGMPMEWMKWNGLDGMRWDGMMGLE
jgi:hypothetical protein